MINVGGRAYISTIGNMSPGDTMSASMAGPSGNSMLPPIPSEGVNPHVHLGQVGSIQPTIPKSFPMISVSDPNGI